MRSLLLLIALSFSFFLALGQNGDFRGNRIYADKLLNPPSDTTFSKWGIARIGTICYIGNGIRWSAAIGGVGIGNIGSGLNKSFGDTIAWGGKVDYHTQITVTNRHIVGSQNVSVHFGNRSVDSLYNDQNYPNGTRIAQGPTYAVPLMQFEQANFEKYNDTALLSYGGNIQANTYSWFDSVSTHYDNNLKPILLPYGGINSESQIFPPRDQTGLYHTQFGQHQVALTGSFAIGSSVGYNIDVKSNIPLYAYPTGLTVNADLNRKNAFDRTRIITGYGLAQISINYRGRQGTISPTSIENGSYINKIIQTQYVGNTSQDISTGGATKAKIMLVSKIDSSIAMDILDQWRPTNEVANGYGITQRGKWDMNLFKGSVFLGDQPTMPSFSVSNDKLRIDNRDSITATNKSIVLRIISSRFVDSINLGDLPPPINIAANYKLIGPTTVTNSNGYGGLLQVDNFFSTANSSGTKVITFPALPAYAYPAASIVNGFSNGGNGNLTANGWMSTLNVAFKGNSGGTQSVENYIYLNVGTHIIGNNPTITNAHGIYINPIKPSNVVNSYSLYQAGLVDSNRFDGIVRISNIVRQLKDTSSIKLVCVTDNGTVIKTDWPSETISNSFSQVGSSTTTFTVTIGSTLANNTYRVNVTPTAALSAAPFYVTNKTTTTFDVTYLSGLTGTVTFDWSLNR